jgi:hypothetical protein
MKVGRQEPFEKPEGGEYIGTIIDVIDKPNQPVTFGGVTKMQDQITFVWTLAYPNGQVATDSKGRPYQIFETYNAFISEGSKPSKLYRALVQILNAAPPQIDDTAQIENILLGRSSGLLVMKSPKTTNPSEFTSKVIGHMPLKAGQIAPKAPADFVRTKDRAKQQAGPNAGQTTQTYTTRPVQAAPAVNLNAPTPQTPEAF